MLAFLATDANIASEPLQQALRESAAKSFNRMTIDTDSSTNDTVLILATGSAGNPEITDTTNGDYEAFCEALDCACIELAKKIARDGEGATKLVEVVVSSAKNETEGEMAARAIAESPLVKTAVFGSDANWGRIMMAAGKIGARNSTRIRWMFGSVTINWSRMGWTQGLMRIKRRNSFPRIQ